MTNLKTESTNDHVRVNDEHVSIWCPLHQQEVVNQIVIGPIAYKIHLIQCFDGHKSLTRHLYKEKKNVKL